MNPIRSLNINIDVIALTARRRRAGIVDIRHCGEERAETDGGVLAAEQPSRQVSPVLLYCTAVLQGVLSWAGTSTERYNTASSLTVTSQTRQRQSAKSFTAGDTCRR